MNDTELKELILQRLSEGELGFTTKQDPLYIEPTSFYELDQYGEPTEETWQKIFQQVRKLIGDGALNLSDAVDLWIEEQYNNYRLYWTSVLTTKFEPKPIVSQIKAFTNIDTNKIADKNKRNTPIAESVSRKTENIKRTLKEASNRSLDVINDKIEAEDFDADSNEGKIVLRTKELFNALSNNNYDIQVTFDNGESQSTILLGQQGANVIITITDNTSPLKAFVSGNFEVIDSIINTLKNVIDTIKNI